MTTYPPGTLFPLDAQPHLPTMCHYRTTRRGGARRTVLCRDTGTIEIVDADGQAATILTPDGPMPFRFCAKHARVMAKQYPPSVRMREVTPK